MFPKIGTQVLLNSGTFSFQQIVCHFLREKQNKKKQNFVSVQSSQLSSNVSSQTLCVTASIFHYGCLNCIECDFRLHK